jgi:hypothetical protein
MQIRIRGKVWKVTTNVRLRNASGSCDHPTTTGKTIKIDKKLEGQDKLDVLIHEMIHAGMWDLCEETVGELSTDIARALWRLGWREVSK